MKRIKVSTLMAAIKKNGYAWARNGVYRYTETSADGKDVIYACVLGQAALNLNVDAGEVGSALLSDTFPTSMWRQITNYNDKEATSYDDAVRFAFELLEPYKDKIITIRTYDGEYSEDD